MLREDLAAALSGAMVAPYFPVDAESLACERHIRNITEADVVLFPPATQSLDPRVERATDANTQDAQVVVRAYHSQNHPRGGVFCYRIECGGKSLVYASDTEGYAGGDQRLIRFAEGADLLVHDAQYRASEYIHGLKQGWGHSTVDMAVEVAQAASVKRLALFHHGPTNDETVVAEMEREAQAQFPSSFAAYEGLTLSL